jgi:putative MATE family efflux protein
MTSQKHFILNAPLKSVMWQTSWPAVLAIVLYGLNNFLDAILVGHLMNSNALAAVGIAYPLSQITLGFGRLIGIGSSASISMWLGSGQQDKLYRMFGTVNVLSLLGSLLFSIPAYVFAEQLVHMMGARGEMAVLSAEYFRVTLLGSLFWIHGFSVNMMIRGEGKMRTAAWMISLGLGIDVLLKPIFISTLGWGVSGAAWATNIGMLMYSVLGLWHFSKGNSSFKTKWASFAFDRAIASKIMSLGLPEMIFTVMAVLQNLVVFNTLSRFGSEPDLVFYTVINRFYLFLLTPLFGLMRGLQPVAGMNYGAGKLLRARQSLLVFIGTGLLIVLPFWAVTMCFPHQVLSAIMPDMAITGKLIYNLRIYMSVLPLLPVIVMALSYFPAINEGKKASMLAISRQAVFYLPLMYVLPMFFGIDSVYWGSAAIDLTMTLVTLVFLWRSFKPAALCQEVL